jgi:hypothetical protein
MNIMAKVIISLAVPKKVSVSASPKPVKAKASMEDDDFDAVKFMNKAAAPFGVKFSLQGAVLSVMKDGKSSGGIKWTPDTFTDDCLVDSIARLSAQFKKAAGLVPVVTSDEDEDEQTLMFKLAK